MNRDHLLKSLTPLYIGRTAAFVMETADANSDQVEERIESVGGRFRVRRSEISFGAGRPRTCLEGGKRCYHNGTVTR